MSDFESFLMIVGVLAVCLFADWYTSKRATEWVNKFDHKDNKTNDQ